jgi:hypothetical protein
VNEPRARVALITLLLAGLVGGGVAVRLVARTTPHGSAPAGAVVAAAVDPASAESSAWYCAGGTDSHGGAPATIVLSNSATRTVAPTLTGIEAGAPGAPGALSPLTIHLAVPGGSQVDVPPAQLAQPGSLAVAVVVDGGGVAVSEVVSSPLGWSMAPCASTTASQWFFAQGATTQGGGLVLSLFNPGSTDATADISLVTSTAGYLSPPAYQGVDVPARALVTENVGDHIAADPVVASLVSTISGSLVAAELQSTGTPGNGGITVTLGSPAPAPQWVFAQNTDVTGGNLAFHVLNPSTRPTQVSLSIGLPRGAAAEPLSLDVPAQSVATLVAQDQTRIPANTPYAATFTSRGAGIVVARQVTSPPGAPAAEPADGGTPGVALGSTRWLVPAVASPGTGAWALAVDVIGGRPARVRIADGTGRALPGQGNHVVSPGSPLVIGPSPGPPFGTAPFEVVSDQPVAVELDAAPVASPGVVVVPALGPG